jgi:hypothetical protein
LEEATVSRSTTLRRCCSLLLALSLLLAAGPCLAGKYDLDLGRFWSRNFMSPADLRPRDGARSDIEFIMADLAAALGPRFVGPAETTGSYGFSVAFDYAVTDIKEDSRGWRTAMTDPNLGAADLARQEGADSVLQSYQIHVRKGLPYSMELGASVTRLVDSRLWGLGFEFKFAPIEGLKYLPDLALRSAFNTAINTGDYNLYVITQDVALSKRFGLVGLWSMAPYVGYQFQPLLSTSNVITVFSNLTGQPEQVTFAGVWHFNQYGVAGLRVTAAMVDLGFEYAMGKDNSVYSFRLGLDF